MTNINKFKEVISLCDGAQNNKDVKDWKTLHQFDNISSNKNFDAKVYQQGNKIVITFAGTNMESKNDKENFNSNLSRQSGNIVILPDLSKNERGSDIPIIENHYLHNYKPYQLNKAQLYEKPDQFSVHTYNDITNSRIEYPAKLQLTQLTGFAANLDINQVAQILGIQLLNQQSGQPQQNQSGLFGYTNPLTGSNHIYTREEVGAMSKDEFAKHEKEIMAQTKVFNGTMPTNGDLQREAMTGGGVVYVNSYTRSDGTEVKGYYRSRPRFKKIATNRNIGGK